jgi:hypothetical protein
MRAGVEVHRSVSYIAPRGQMMKNINKQIIFLGIIGVCGAVSTVAQDAVTVFTNGTVYTSNAQAPSH